jgi:hypothetical protein
MGQVFYQAQETWADGLVTSIEADQIPASAYPFALNTELSSVGGSEAIIAKRRGVRVMNETPISGAPAILHGFEYRRVSGGSQTSQNLLFSSAGRLDEIDQNGNLTTITTGLTAGLYPSVVTANNRCYWVNGVDRKKYDGSSVTNFGLVAPTSAEWGSPTDVTTGGTMPHSSTYEIALTYGNSLVGSESSRSTEKVVMTAADGVNTHRLTVTWSAPADSQVDTVYVYIRKTDPVLNTLFLRAGTFTASALTGTLDVPDSTILTLLIQAPGLSSNDPPPSGVRYLAYHQGRIFAADDFTLFYSAITAQGAQLEAFDAESATEPINPGDGQRITGLHSAHEMLVIFKERSIWALFGTNPATWDLRQIVSDIGCISHRSIVTVGGTTYWWSQEGPVSWDATSSPPEQIGKVLIAPTIGQTGLVYSNPLLFHAAAETGNQRVLFGVSLSGDRADAIIPFSYRLKRWEATRWDPIDPACLTVFTDSNGRPWTYLGSHAGQLFRVSDGTDDGLPAGTTKTGTFVAAATTASTITDAGATFTTSGGALTERKVTIVDSRGIPITTHRARITSNTGTALTLAAPISGLVVGDTYTYYVGGPDWQWDTRWEDFGDPFWKKRFEFLYLGLVVGDPDAILYADMAFDFRTESARVKTLTIEAVAQGTGVWNNDQWDEATWGALTPAELVRERIARTGRNWRVRLRNHAPNVTAIIRKVGVRAERMTDKR